MKYLFYSLVVVSIWGCDLKEHQTWYDVETDKNLIVAPIDSSDWSYPWYMIQKPQGGFENTMGAIITAQDTAHLVHNSNCQIIRDSVASRLHFCEAFLNKDTLELRIFNKTVSDNQEMTIKVLKEWFLIDFNSHYFFPYENYQINVQAAYLKLSQSDFKVGTTIKGVTNITFEESFKKNKNQTWQQKLQVLGDFQAIIQKKN